MFERFLHPLPAQAQPLDPVGSWDRAAHLWSQPEFDALAVAGFSGRPLLLKGEPGIGKSQLARAAAALLGWRFDYEVITPRFEPQDLLWRYDAVRRLAASHSGDVGDDRQYVTPGVMWRAIEPAGGAVQPCVVLIDEIDKADSDLPNSLLEVLANRAFKSPWGRVPARSGSAEQGLLVLITSNDERELPLAFMRRCVVLEMTAPDERQDDGRFVQWLLERGRARYAALGAKVLETAAALVRRDRLDSPPGLGARPGLAEYLDLLRALEQIAASTDPAVSSRDPLALLARLSPYVLRKQGQPQGHDETPAAGSVPAA